MACERGTSFGYNSLVADMRALPEMARNGTPVIMDATHSVQQPGGNGGSSGGQREFAPVMARCAVSLDRLSWAALDLAGDVVRHDGDASNAADTDEHLDEIEQMLHTI